MEVLSHETITTALTFTFNKLVREHLGKWDSLTEVNAKKEMLEKIYVYKIFILKWFSE